EARGRLATCRTAAERPDLVTCAHQVRRHRPSHHAEPDKANDCHPTEPLRPLIHRLITVPTPFVRRWHHAGYFDIPESVNGVTCPAEDRSRDAEVRRERVAAV